MRNTKIYLWIVLVVCLAASAQAIVIDDFTLWNSSVLVMSMENSALDSSPKATNPSVASGSPTFVASCYIGGCYGFNGDDAFNAGGTRLFGTGSTDYMLCGWANLSSSSGDDSSLMGVNPTGAEPYTLWRAVRSANQHQAGQWQDGGSSVFADGTDIQGVGWTHVCLSYNGTHIANYENGVLINSGAITTTSVGTSVFAIGSEWEISYQNFMIGALDEVYWFNKSFYQPTYTYAGRKGTAAVAYYLSQKVSALGNGTAAGLPDSITIISPTNNSVNNSLAINISFTPTFNTSLTATSCNLTTNISGTWKTTYNISYTTLDMCPFSGLGCYINGSISTFNFTAPTSGDYLYGLTCYDADANMFSSQNRTIAIDTINPMLVGTNFTNNTLIANENKLFQFNFTDPHLFRVTAQLNSLVLENRTGLTDPDYMLNISINSTLLTLINTLTIEAADGHTANELVSADSWDVKNGLFNNYLQYDIGSDDTSIKMYEVDQSFGDSWDTQQYSDRFKESFTPSKTKDVYTFVVESNEKIFIYNSKDGKYGGKWLITGNHWKDFVVEGENYKIGDIRQINDYKVEVDVSGIKGDSIQFSSTGDLNVVTLVYTVLGSSAEVQYTTPVIEGQTTIYNLNLNISDTSLIDVNASLLLNGSLVSATKVQNPTNYTFSVTTSAPLINLSVINISNAWQLTFQGGGTASLPFNQTVYQINIDNCTTPGSVPAITFYGRDEETDGAVNDTRLNIDLDVWFDEFNESRAFNFSFSGNDHYSLCIYPNTTTYLTNAIAEYGTKGATLLQYTDRKYYLVNYTFDNIVDSVYLYHLNQSVSTDVKLIVYDERTSQRIPNAYIKILRYYPGEGSYKTVEIERTDDSGETLGKLVLADVFYKFIVEYPQGTIALDTEVQKILSNTKTFSIASEPGIVLSDWKNYINTLSTASCNSQTGVCRFVFSDKNNVARNATALIYETNDYGKSLIHSNSTLSSSGALVYTAALANGSYYTAEYYIDGTLVNSADMDIGESFLTAYGSSSVSLLIPLILLLIVVMAALIDVGAIGIIVGSMVVIGGAVLIGILPLGAVAIWSFMAMAGVLVFKLWRN